MASKAETEPTGVPAHEPPGECKALIAEGADDVSAVAALGEAYRSLTDQLARVVIGQQRVIEQVMVAMFCHGHALLVGVPGLAKTLLVRTLADVLHLSFKRFDLVNQINAIAGVGENVLGG